MITLRFGDTFVAKYPSDHVTGALHIVGRDRDNRGRPMLVIINPLLPLRNVSKGTPIFEQGDRFEAEAELFHVTSVEGFALGIDRIDIDSASTTPAA